MKNRSDRAQVSKISIEKAVALVSGAKTSEKPDETEWVLDSGASSHMIGDEGYFQLNFNLQSLSKLLNANVYVKFKPDRAILT